MAPKWNCDVCCRDFQDYTSIHIQRSKVCAECVFTLFRKARDFEFDYPVRWGGSVLHPTEFKHLAKFNQAFIHAYERKEVEYRLSPRNRVYCSHSILSSNAKGVVYKGSVCGEFIDPRKRRAAGDTLAIGRCPDCSGLTCMVCTQPFLQPQDVCTHACLGFTSGNERDDAAFESRVRGKHWQYCPNKQCHRRIELSEACNHMTCVCDTELCFVCGKEVGEDDDDDPLDYLRELFTNVETEQPDTTNTE